MLNKYLFIYNRTYGSCFIQWVKICCYYFNWCTNCSTFGQWESLQGGFCVFLTCSHHSLRPFLLTDRIRCSRLFVPFLSQPWHQSFLQGILVPFSEEQYEADIWILIVRVAVPRTPQWKKLGNVCRYVYMYADIHIYVFIYTYKHLYLFHYQSIYIENHEFTVTPPIPVQGQFWLSLSLFVMPFIGSEKPGPCQYANLHKCSPCPTQAPTPCTEHSALLCR